MEFLELEKFSSVQNFLDKAYSYMLFFNLRRPNSYKENKTPFELAKMKNSNITEKISFLPPIILDELVEKRISQRGYDVRATPSILKKEEKKFFRCFSGDLLSPEFKEKYHRR